MIDWYSSLNIFSVFVSLSATAPPTVSAGCLVVMTSEGAMLPPASPPPSPPRPRPPVSPCPSEQFEERGPGEAAGGGPGRVPELDLYPSTLGLLSLKQMQERGLSLVNQALLRHKLAASAASAETVTPAPGPEHVKLEAEDTAETRDNNNDNKSLNNNNNNSHEDEDSRDTDTAAEAEARLSFEEARRRFLSSSVTSRPLAFSVENILAPGKFGREMDGDQDLMGEHDAIVSLIPVFSVEFVAFVAYNC